MSKTIYSPSPRIVAELSLLPQVQDPIEAFAVGTMNARTATKTTITAILQELIDRALQYPDHPDNQKFIAQYGHQRVNYWPQDVNCWPQDQRDLDERASLSQAAPPAAPSQLATTIVIRNAENTKTIWAGVRHHTPDETVYIELPATPPAASAQQDERVPECNGSHDYAEIADGASECTGCTGAQQDEREAVRNDPAVAAIQFALEADEGMVWLRLWNEGEFKSCREEWPEAPEECYIGADPLLEPRAAQQVQADAGLPTVTELTALLPGPYYMDPPDGGSVTLLEQLQRMAQDAARWRNQVQADASREQEQKPGS